MQAIRAPRMRYTDDERFRLQAHHRASLAARSYTPLLLFPLLSVARANLVPPQQPACQEPLPASYSNILRSNRSSSVFWSEKIKSRSATHRDERKMFKQGKKTLKAVRVKHAPLCPLSILLFMVYRVRLKSSCG